MQKSPLATGLNPWKPSPGAAVALRAACKPGALCTTFLTHLAGAVLGTQVGLSTYINDRRTNRVSRVALNGHSMQGEEGSLRLLSPGTTRATARNVVPVACTYSLLIYTPNPPAAGTGRTWAAKSMAMSCSFWVAMAAVAAKALGN